MKTITAFFSLIALLTAGHAIAQDPHFSQFFMAPQFVNPAAVGIGSGNWRVMSNYRQQWGNAGTAFNTKTIAADWSLVGKKDRENHFGIGLSGMTDESMKGAFKSNYASCTIAYQLKLNEFYQLGLGIQTMYGNRMIDYSQLNFGEQFTSGGFDVSLPSGEVAVTQMKPFIALGAGLLFNYNNKNDVNIDMGISGFNLNKPMQSFLQDNHQFLPESYSAHINLEWAFSEHANISGNAIYKQQAVQHYFAIGGALGLEIAKESFNGYLFSGIWFRSGDAIYPYLGFQFNQYKLGMSYDITTSKQIQGPMPPQSFELSLVIKQPSQKPGVIPCPGPR